MPEVNADAIPDELKERDQWMVWDTSADRKQPVGVTDEGLDYRASWTDPDDWCSFRDALAQARAQKSIGIGFVFGADNDDYARGLYGGLDLDGCVDGNGPADWLPSLQPFIERDAYAEYSPSGEGLHIPIVGFEEPEWWTDVGPEGDHKGIEAYGSKFFTFTGDRIGGSGSAVVEAGEWLTEWMQDATEQLTGERPWEDNNTELTDHKSEAAPPTTNGNARQIATAVDNLDAREVAEKTIVSRWNESANASGDNKAFFPVWGGSDCSGTANIVDRDWWTDTGTVGGSGGPLEMAAIDMGEISHNGCSPGDVSGELWWDAVDHLRDLGFAIPEHNGGSGTKHGPKDESQEEIKDEGDDDADASDDVDNGSTTTWGDIQSVYAMDGVSAKEARRDAAMKLMNEYHLLTIEETDDLLIYNPADGIFDHGGEADLRRILARNLGGHYSQKEAREIIETIRDFTRIERDLLNGGAQEQKLLPVQNGVLNLETRELNDHDPMYRNTRVLPVEYDAEAEAEHFDQFLDDITSREEDRQTMMEMVGATLWPTYLKGKFQILFGEGQNGKSVYYDVVERLLGSENIAGWDLQDFADNRFATSALPGKMANIGGDMESAKLQNTGILKKLTGGDTVMVEEKGKPAFEFENSATLLFAANRPPTLGERTRAIERRLVPVHLPHQFTDADDDNPDARPKEELIGEMTTDEELSGILNMSLDGLDRLRDNGDVSLPETGEERLEYYEQWSDPIKQFALNCLKNEEESQIQKEHIYQTYKNWAIANDHTVKSKSVFFRVLGKCASFDYLQARPSQNGERVNVADNASFKEPAHPFVPAGCEYPPDRRETDDDTGRSATDFNKVEKGVQDINSVTIAEKLPAPDWLEAKGYLEDDNGEIVEYQCEGLDPLSSVSERATVDLENAKVKITSSGTTVVLSAITEVHGKADAGVNNQLSEATTDGGQSPQHPPETDKSTSANVDRLKNLLEEKQPAKEAELVNRGVQRYEWSDHQTWMQTIKKAKKQGEVMASGDGLTTT